MCELRDKMQVVYKELTYDGVKFKATKVNLIHQNHGRIAGKIH